MNVKRIIFLALVALMVSPVFPGCTGSGPVSSVKGFIKALLVGEPERINAFLDKKMQTDKEDNIWEDMDSDDYGYDIDTKEARRAVSRMFSAAKYKLQEQEGDEATVKVTFNGRLLMTAMLGAIDDEDEREELEKDIKDMDEEDFINTATFKLELDDGKWIITYIQNFDFPF